MSDYNISISVGISRFCVLGKLREMYSITQSLCIISLEFNEFGEKAWGFT